MMILLPAASGVPNPGAATDSVAPGAQAPSQGALSRSELLGRPLSPKQVQPSPGSAASSCSAAAFCDGSTR